MSREQSIHHTQVTLSINGDEHSLDIDTRTTLLASAHPDLHCLALDLLGD